MTVLLVSDFLVSIVGWIILCFRWCLDSREGPAGYIEFASLGRWTSDQTKSNYDTVLLHMHSRNWGMILKLQSGRKPSWILLATASWWCRIVVVPTFSSAFEDSSLFAATRATCHSMLVWLSKLGSLVPVLVCACVGEHNWLMHLIYDIQAVQLLYVVELWQS